MQSTNSVRPASTPTSSESESESASIPGHKHSTIEILWLSGPNQDEYEQARLKSLLEKTNLTHKALGDGASTLFTQDIRKTITEELTSSSHVFFNGHGNYIRGKHYIQIGNHITDEHNEVAISSRDLLHMVQKKSLSANNDKKKRTLHIVTCHAGAMRNEIQPGSESWKQGYLMLYSGKKSTLNSSTHDSLAASLQYLHACKVRQIEADPLDLFLHAANAQSDCITLLGGDLHEPLISHPPKTVQDMYLHEQENRIKGNSEDLSLLKKHQLKLRKELKLTQAEKIKQIQSILFARIERHDAFSINQILDRVPDLINSRDMDGLTPLLFACTENNPEMVNLMLRYDAIIDETDHEKYTPLHLSVILKNPEITKILLENGASLSAKAIEDDNALFIACKMNQKIMVQLLLQHGAADFIDEPNHKGNTALMCAAKNGNLDITKLLLQAGAKTSLKNHKGQTALSIAKNKKYQRIAELITQTNKLKNRPSISMEAFKAPGNF